ncbi:ABC-type nitrate/sulfonate/bicarbonate transport system, ATPase component [Desulfosporosinus orientis DSM 765]|uniref:ABC-type nitrate/sulfonate/bicarbonate transport system, ATPase component n=1 Tax=Desulfosporosinus orientis (strain ATCC 19365 / DSM 765 / NCIMB 8382 / VKM B-1628 / Singapore I) TaxID=768706 RepID=G7WJ35_DESOD|nr:ABC transporter ATP-binding protein [Desulfosporosinus orientis]AET70347.1 ABC-type nitrate/sulfonate/bicarbonate transport system, ATPase component [Desulfosporosinus orientis DSM 765]
MSLLEIHNVCKNFKIGNESVSVLNDLTLTVNKGELVCLLGVSGCGKTTFLRLISGLEKQTSGTILINGTQYKIRNRTVNMVFQEPRLFPWLSVQDNIIFGLKRNDHSKAKNLKVTEIINKLGLSPYIHEMPYKLSGGIAQRVALARAIVTEPELLLLDEPFSSLDSITKNSIMEDLLDLWKSANMTIIHVTHNLDEAIMLAQKIIVLKYRNNSTECFDIMNLSYPRNPESDYFKELKSKVFNSY